MQKNAWYISFIVKSYNNNELTMWILNLNENRIDPEKLYGIIKDNANQSVNNLRITIDKFVTKEFDPRIWKDIWSGIIIHSQYLINKDIINETFIKMVTHFSINFNEINKHLMESIHCIIHRWPYNLRRENEFEEIKDQPLRWINCETFLKFMAEHPKAIVKFEELLPAIINKGKSELLQLIIDCDFLQYDKCKESGLIAKVWIIIDKQKQNNGNNSNGRNQHQIIHEQMLNETSSIFQKWVDK